MKKLYKNFEVIYENNFYNMMRGKLSIETHNTVILEFKLDAELGGDQRVEFFKEQVRYLGEY